VFHVTGVQTCALPICPTPRRLAPRGRSACALCAAEANTGPGAAKGMPTPAVVLSLTHPGRFRITPERACAYLSFGRAAGFGWLGGAAARVVGRWSGQL